MDMFYSVMQSTLLFMIPLMIVALGGLFSEKSGIVNIALEGKMIMGAFTGIAFITTFQDRLPGQPILILGLLIATGTGILVSLLHAFASITLKANQIISGVAINMFAPAFAVYVARFHFDTQHILFENQFRIASVPLFGRIPILGPMFFQGAHFTSLLGVVLLAVSAFVIYKTKFGLRLRACGEHPQAADSVGVSVVGIRYAGVILSGALAGMGGLIWVVPISTTFSGSVYGYGFLALAVLIFSGWRPVRILYASFFFGLMQTISVNHGVIGFLPEIIPGNFYRMLPFIMTLVVLAFTSKDTMAPKAVGQPYDKGGR